MKKLVIIGAGGHGKVVADAAAKSGYEEIVFLDDGNVSLAGKRSVVGTSKDYEKYLMDSDFVVAIGNNAVRERIQNMLAQAGARIATIIHPDAVIGEDVVVGQGTVVMAGVIVNSGSNIGRGVILNTCCSVDHDNKIGDFCHISVGTHLAGTVTVGRRSFIGIGACVINNVEICDDCIIGAGAVVIRDVPESCTAVGNPAKTIKFNK